MKAKDLIAQRGLKQAPDLTPAMVKEVKQIIDYNDAMGTPQRRVGAAAVLDMLKDMGWPGRSRLALDQVCQRQLKRSGWARK